MAPKKNPLKLNPLQLKTLAILQQMATTPVHARPLADTGDVAVGNWPPPHGDHFHIGDAVVSGRDATGLRNPAVFAALQRKGLLRAAAPEAVVLTPEGLAYETGVGDAILHRNHQH